MTIFTDTFIPYEYRDKEMCLRHIIDRCQGIKKSLIFVEMDNEHLLVRCPIVGDYLEITGTVEELNYIHKSLTDHRWYKR